MALAPMLSMSVCDTEEMNGKPENVRCDVNSLDGQCRR